VTTGETVLDRDAEKPVSGNGQPAVGEQRIHLPDQIPMTRTQLREPIRDPRKSGDLLRTDPEHSADTGHLSVRVQSALPEMKGEAAVALVRAGGDPEPALAVVHAAMDTVDPIDKERAAEALEAINHYR